MTTEQTCEHCKFWKWGETWKRGECRRRAPITVPRVDESAWKIATAIKLLLWWYVREHSDEEGAEIELKAYGLDIENHDGDSANAMWPTTEAGDGCGEWGAKEE